MIRDLIIGLVLAIIVDLLADGSTRLANRIAKRAAAQLPRRHRERWCDEWRADLEARPRLLRPLDALGFFPAAFSIRREYLRIAFAKRGISPAFFGLAVPAKRALDILFASLALTLLAPLLYAISILIFVTSEGPIFFRQRRYAPNGREVNLYKFRTIAIEGGVVQNRITPLGRYLRWTSLDALPQLLNVLQGTMSIVGLRAHPIAHHEAYRKLVTACRTPMKPGLIVWEPNEDNLRKRKTDDVARDVRNDADYLLKWSIWLDVTIMFKALVRWVRGAH